MQSLLSFMKKLFKYQPKTRISSCLSFDQFEIEKIEMELSLVTEYFLKTQTLVLFILFEAKNPMNQHSFLLLVDCKLIYVFCIWGNIWLFLVLLHSTHPTLSALNWLSWPLPKTQKISTEYDYEFFYKRAKLEIIWFNRRTAGD